MLLPDYERRNYPAWSMAIAPAKQGVSSLRERRTRVCMEIRTPTADLWQPFSRTTTDRVCTRFRDRHLREICWSGHANSPVGLCKLALVSAGGAPLNRRYESPIVSLSVTCSIQGSDSCDSFQQPRRLDRHRKWIPRSIWSTSLLQKLRRP